MSPVDNASLPHFTIPFFGRETEQALIRRWCQSPDGQLLTLVGLGGIGKTRLAVEAARQCLDLFPDGIFFVPLQTVTVPELMLPTIAEMTGMVTSAGSDLRQQLASVLDGQQRLLILDSFEHLLPDVQGVIDLLHAAPTAKLLITSREKLNIQAENVLHVGSLDYPAQPQVEDAARFPAVALLLSLLHRLEPEAGVTPAILDGASLICRQVQGMPLALELAVGWADTLSLPEIAQEIARSLDFLETRMRDYPDRHRSMRAVLEPSLATLSAGDRAVLEKLCLFRGSFAREAAAMVAEADLHTLALLVNKSLVRHLPSGRYEIHELVRQYGAARLEHVPGERAATQSRYCAYYADFLEAQWQEMLVAMRSAPFKRIDAEVSHCLQALRWVVASRDSARIWQMINPLWNYMAIRFRFNEGAYVFGTALQALNNGSADESLIGNLLLRHGYFLACLNARDLAFEQIADGLRRLQQHPHPDPDMHIVGYLCAAIGYWIMGEYELMDTVAQQGYDYARQHQHAFGIRSLLCFLACAATALGDMERAQALGQQCYDVAVEQGDWWIEGTTALLVLAELAYRRQEYAEAQRWCFVALRCYDDLNQVFARTYVWRKLAACAVSLRDMATAQQYFTLCLQTLEEHGLGWQIPDLWLHMGQLFAAEGFTDRAAACLEQARTYPACRQPTYNAATQWLATLSVDPPAISADAIWAPLPPVQMVAVAPAPPAIDGLSMREIEVLRLLAEGLSNAEIAQRLCIAVGTVKVHTRHIYEKLAVNTRTQAAASALRLGLL